MKTKEELNALREEINILNKKLAELTKEELAQVCGGVEPSVYVSFEERIRESGFIQADV